MKTYFLSKTIPLIFSPLGLSLILLFVFIFNKKTKFVYIAISFLILLSNGIVSGLLWMILEYPWKRVDYNSVGSANGIVVLSTGRHLPPGSSKIIEWNDPDRFIAGIKLYQSGKSYRLIFTGGIHPFDSNLPPEGDIYIREAISLGIPEKNLLTTYPVLNTFQEAKAISKIFDNEKDYISRKIILVTSAFHMKRAKKVFEKEGFTVIPYPVDFKSRNSFISLFENPINWFPSASSLDRSSSAIREIIGRIIYRTW